MALGEQTTAEKSTSKAASDIRALRKQIRDEELGVVEAQNELAKLQVAGAKGLGGQGSLRRVLHGGTSLHAASEGCKRTCVPSSMSRGILSQGMGRGCRVSSMFRAT